MRYRDGNHGAVKGLPSWLLGLCPREQPLHPLRPSDSGCSHSISPGTGQLAAATTGECSAPLAKTLPLSRFHQVAARVNAGLLCVFGWDLFWTRSDGGFARVRASVREARVLPSAQMFLSVLRAEKSRGKGRRPSRCPWSALSVSGAFK